MSGSETQTISLCRVLPNNRQRWSEKKRTKNRPRQRTLRQCLHNWWRGFCPTFSWSSPSQKRTDWVQQIKYLSERHLCRRRKTGHFWRGTRVLQRLWMVASIFNRRQVLPSPGSRCHWRGGKTRLEYKRAVCCEDDGGDLGQVARSCVYWEAPW